MNLKLLAMLFIALTAHGEPEPQDAVVGQWFTSEKDARIEIFKADGKFSGKIVWAKATAYPEGDPEAGKPKHDRNNPDLTKRAQSIVGMTLLRDFEYAGDNSWGHGTLYNPENGKTYKAHLSLANDGTLKVRGYVGISLLGETTVWTRYKETDPPKGKN